jgi:hypothetical protein
MVRLRLFASRSVRARVVGWVERSDDPTRTATRVPTLGPRCPSIQPTWALACTAAAAYATTTPASAHGFGQRYELPLPLSLYLFGAAATVALSFVVLGLFVRRRSAPRAHARIDLLDNPVGRTVGGSAVVWSLRLAVLALFLVAILAGLLGNQNPYRNIAPTLVWIIWWVGLAYVSAFVGDIWALVNPWRTVFDAADWLYRRVGVGSELGLRRPYPQALGVWPACMLLLAFCWIELVYANAAAPAHIARLAVAYSALTWTGMLVFGRDVWLQHGEVFSLVFGTFARFAPTEAKDNRLLLRLPGAGLLDDRQVSTSMMAFVLLLLATVLYDGLTGTGEWTEMEGALRAHVPGSAETSGMAIKTAGLFVLWGLFLGAYLGISTVMSRVAAGRSSPIEIARSFALTLVPIAIGYHFAHYLVFLLVHGQYIIPLLSDPFGYGWNLFGTAGYRVDIAIAGARLAWYAALAAIVTGHVTAVYLAHMRALRVFEPHRVALAAQVPLTALMVLYTFIGLSITAEPIVESRAAAQRTAVAAERVAVPENAVLAQARTGLLQPVGPDKTARVKLTYKVLGSAFHDATKTDVADLLYAYAFAYRWGVRGNGEAPHYDPFVDAATAPLRRHLVAVRAAGVDTGSKSFRVGDVNFVREVFTIEVYLDIVPDDADWNAVVAPPWSTLPWHVLVLMEEAVTRGWAAFSQAEAVRRGVPWLDLVRSEEINAKLASLLPQFEREGSRPKALLALVTEEEARRRWAALTKFYQAGGHFLVTNGPYKLKRWSPQSVTLEAFRDLSYPLGVGSYDAYALPRRGFITKVDWSDERLTLSGEIEVVEKFQRSTRLVRVPLKSVSAAVLKRSAPECRYTVTDPDGRVVLAGAALLGVDANFQINLKGRLPPGPYMLSAIIAVNGNTMNAEIHRIPLATSSQP